MPISAVLVFLTVADDPGHSQIYYCDRLKLPRSSVSRYVNLLQKNMATNTPGLDLILQEKNPDDERQSQLLLTANGQRLSLSLVKVLNDSTKK